MKVLFGDPWNVDNVIPVKNREEAVSIIKEELCKLCQEGDKIIWDFTNEDVEMKREKPSFATIINPYGKYIDVTAVIDYKGE